jgi:hypothetical protein
MQATPPHYEDNSEPFTQFMQLHIFKTNQLVLTKHSSIIHLPQYKKPQFFSKAARVWAQFLQYT